MRSSVRVSPEKEEISDQFLVWLRGDPGRLPGRGDIQVGFYRMNKNLPKRQDVGVRNMFQVQRIAGAKARKCENSLMLRSQRMSEG